MRDGWPSLTALAVAVGRGVGITDQQRDPSASRLVPRPLGLALDWLGRPGVTAPMRAALRVASAGMVDHVSLRHASIDAALEHAIESGARQLVILGAGLDGRAWRLESLRDAIVFEVDHPDTQAGKRRRVTGLAPCAAAIRFVPVDFEREDLSLRLAAADHDPARPTAWIWEGVTPYLAPTAVESTLTHVAARSAPGSRLLVSYATPQLNPWASAPLDRALRLGFRVLGEPLRGTVTPEAFTRQLERHGWVVLEDTSNREWAERHAGSAAMARLFSSERLAVAEARAAANPTR